MFEKIKFFLSKKFIESHGLTIYHFRTTHLLSKKFLLHHMPDIGEKIKKNDKIAQGFFIGTLGCFYELSGILANLNNKKLKPERLANMIHEVFYKDWNMTNKEVFDIYVKTIETYNLHTQKKLLGEDLEKFKKGLKLLEKYYEDFLLLINFYKKNEK